MMCTSYLCPFHLVRCVLSFEARCRGRSDFPYLRPSFRRLRCAATLPLCRLLLDIAALKITEADTSRPDDFTILMALGDSISAALLARDGVRDPEFSSPPFLPSEDAQAILQHDPPTRLPSQAPNSPGDQNLVTASNIQEWRGVSYAIGADPGALTFPNILAHYTHVVGTSTGHHSVVCVGGEYGGCHPPSDGLNAAVSGSIAASLWGQAVGESHGWGEEDRA